MTDNVSIPLARHCKSLKTYGGRGERKEEFQVCQDIARSPSPLSAGAGLIEAEKPLIHEINQHRLAYAVRTLCQYCCYCF